MTKLRKSRWESHSTSDGLITGTVTAAKVVGQLSGLVRVTGHVTGRVAGRISHYVELPSDKALGESLGDRYAFVVGSAM
jgi:hypothetical protein